MARIASEALIERLADWGVDTVFGMPGNGVSGIVEGLRRHQDRVRFILVRHEETAARMASGYAKATGRIGVCLATPGPGGMHLLTGLQDARLDHAPVLAITGWQAGTGYQQEVQLNRLYAGVTCYDEMIVDPVQIPAVTDLAVRTAYARCGVAHITVPDDIQVAAADDIQVAAADAGDADPGEQPLPGEAVQAPAFPRGHQPGHQPGQWAGQWAGQHRRPAIATTLLRDPVQQLRS